MKPLSCDDLLGTDRYKIVVGGYYPANKVLEAREGLKKEICKLLLFKYGVNVADEGMRLVEKWFDIRGKK